MPEVIDVETFEEFLDYIMNHRNVLVEFGADWCGPCKRFYPQLVLFSQRNDDIVCLRVDIDTVPEAVVAYGIQSVPQVALFQQATVDPVWLKGRTALQLEREINAL